MTAAAPLLSAGLAGVRIRCADDAALAGARDRLLDLLQRRALDAYVQLEVLRDAPQATLQCTLQAALAAAWMPEHDTLQLTERLRLDPVSDAGDLEREILLAMLAAPLPFVFPTVDELRSTVQIRRNIVSAARKTALAFHTDAAERPEDCWRYDEDHGFVLRPGCDLIDALTRATQPDATGRVYAFSCYRATEYVVLLGIAQELRDSNPALLAQLQRHSEQRAIRSGRFHDVFLYEYGSMQQPLPLRYYVPGDRLWFRNPDERSADITGFEGSWVFYMGGGLFSNFWVRDRPFTFATKCLELYHWRDGAHVDPAGVLRMDEDIVAQKVRTSLADPVATQRILQTMARLREPRGVYVDGGCIDTTREYPRRVRPGTADIMLPPL